MPALNLSLLRGVYAVPVTADVDEDGTRPANPDESERS